MAKEENKYPLVKKGYAILECPHCDTVCYPDAKAANGTIIYNRHYCQSKHEFWGTMKRFEIDINGDIVEDEEEPS